MESSYCKNQRKKINSENSTLPMEYLEHGWNNYFH